MKEEATGSFLLPPQAATGAPAHDHLYMFLVWLSVFFFALIVGVMIYFVLRYRKRGDVERRTSPISGSFRIELLWSVIPSIILVVIFLWGFRDWMDLSVPPGDSIDVRVLAKKWNWEFDYPKYGIQGAPELIVPVNRPVKVTMSSSDVLHSFFIPAFRIKKDVLPNRYTVIWFQATDEGLYDIACAEYCGTGHSTMVTRVKVVSATEFDSWAKSGGGLDKLPPKELGKYLFTSRGCNACHSTTGDRKGLPGPPLGGKFGTMEKLTTGASVKVDENYVRESIMNPTAKVVAGFPPVMPTFAGRFNDRQINAIIEYVKSLK